MLSAFTRDRAHARGKTDEIIVNMFAKRDSNEVSEMMCKHCDVAERRQCNLRFVPAAISFELKSARQTHRLLRILTQPNRTHSLDS